MRTTIRLDDELLREAKATAARTGRSLTRLIEDALRRELATASTTTTEDRYKIHTFTSPLRPDVDLDSNADLLTTMEST